MGGKRKTFTDPETGRRYRVCRACGTEKPLTIEHFSPSRRDEQGRILQYHGLCKPCSVRQKQERIDKMRENNPYAYRLERKRLQATQRKWRQSHPDRAAKLNRSYKERLKGDPERHARFLETRRLEYHLRAERNGKPLPKVRPRRSGSGQQVVPAAPLLAMFERELARRAALADGLAKFSGVLPELDRTSTEAVCEDYGVDSRKYRGWRSGRDINVTVGIVEAVLERADLEWHEVYAYDDFAAIFAGEGASV